VRSKKRMDAIIEAGSSAAPPPRSKDPSDRAARTKCLQGLKIAKLRVAANPLGLVLGGKMGTVQAGKDINAKIGITAALAIVNPPYTAEQLALEDTFKAIRAKFMF
jgi:hypothetical protein